MSLEIVILIAGLSLALCAFFSAAQVALFFADRAALQSGAANGSVSPGLEKFLARPQWLLATSEVGVILAVSVATVTVTFASIDRWRGEALPAAYLVLAGLFIVFGHITPRVFVQPRATRYAPRMVSLLRPFLYLFSPVVALLLGLSRLMLILTRRRSVEAAFYYSRDDLKLLLTRPLKDGLDEEGRHMIDRVFEFSETVVEEVMIPLVEVEALEEDATVAESLRRVRAKMFSRYPVYQERIDNVVGMIETIGLLEARDGNAPIKPWIEPVKYVPFNKPIDELLFAMQREYFDFAVVVDEYGGCIGLVTREDILEEIVGEIEDEHDEPVVLHRRLEDGRVLANARLEVDDANETLGWNLPEGDYETIGGFLLTLFRRVPRRDERIRYRDLTFTITDATPRAIVEVTVQDDKEPRTETAEAPKD